MNLILFGPPGAGKGTQSELMVKRLNMTHISTGDLLREAMKRQTSLGQKAKEFVDAGRLVPDEVMIGLVEQVVKDLTGRSFILDGFPRTIPQAEALEKLLIGMRLEIEKAVFLEVPRDQLLRRLTGRRVCSGCGAVYHIDTKPTTRQGVCDTCGGTVEQRKDDSEGVIQTRLDAYDKSTRPLKDYFARKGMLVEIPGLGKADEVFDRLQSVAG